MVAGYLDLGGRAVVRGRRVPGSRREGGRAWSPVPGSRRDGGRGRRVPGQRRPAMVHPHVRPAPRWPGKNVPRRQGCGARWDVRHAMWQEDATLLCATLPGGMFTTAYGRKMTPPPQRRRPCQVSAGWPDLGIHPPATILGGWGPPNGRLLGAECEPEDRACELPRTLTAPADGAPSVSGALFAACPSERRVARRHGSRRRPGARASWHA